MSRSLPELQEHAQERSGAFCSRYVKPRRRKGRKATRGNSEDTPARRPQAMVRRGSPQAPSPFYRPRDPEASLFFQVVRDHFDEFERDG